MHRKLFQLLQLFFSFSSLNLTFIFLSYTLYSLLDSCIKNFFLSFSYFFPSFSIFFSSCSFSPIASPIQKRPFFSTCFPPSLSPNYLYTASNDLLSIFQFFFFLFHLLDLLLPFLLFLLLVTNIFSFAVSYFVSF